MKRGVSPLIGVVLLIGLVVALGAITLKWGASVLVKTTEEASREKDVTFELAREVGIDVNKVENVRVFLKEDYVRVEIENEKERKIEDFIIQLYAYDSVFSNTSIGQGLKGFEIKRFNVYFPGYDLIDFYAKKVFVVPVVRDQFGEMQAAEIQARSKKFLCADAARNLRGDFDHKGICNAGDIGPFIEAWTDPDLYDRKYSCTEKDMDCNGDFNYDDIDYFVCVIFGNGECCFMPDGSSNCDPDSANNCPGGRAVYCPVTSNSCAPPCTN
ncbi:MAG: archaellin/type IV pilin N-terminal domain-containing protein [Nanoarchaeota archaeon]